MLSTLVGRSLATIHGNYNLVDGQEENHSRAAEKVDPRAERRLDVQLEAFKREGLCDCPAWQNHRTDCQWATAQLTEEQRKDLLTQRLLKARKKDWDNDVQNAGSSSTDNATTNR